MNTRMVGLAICSFLSVLLIGFRGLLMVWAVLAIGIPALALYYLPSISDEIYTLAISGLIFLIMLIEVSRSGYMT